MVKRYENHGDPRLPTGLYVHESDYDALAARLAEAEQDAALGRIAMRFVDRAGDYCDADPAERICDEFNKGQLYT